MQLAGLARVAYLALCSSDLVASKAAVPRERLRRDTGLSHALGQNEIPPAITVLSTQASYLCWLVGLS